MPSSIINKIKKDKKKIDDRGFGSLLLEAIATISFASYDISIDTLVKSS